MIEIVFLTGCVLFGLSSTYFMFFDRREFNTPMLVSLFTLVSYLIMLSGAFVLNSGDSIIYYTRWLFYAFSCSLLVWEISKRLKLSKEKSSTLVGLNVLVMLTGMLASIFAGNLQVAMFVISSVAFLVIVYEVFNVTKVEEVLHNKLKFFVGILWMLFPVVFIFSPTVLGLASVLVAQLAYLLLDILTKVVFYMVIE